MELLLAMLVPGVMVGVALCGAVRGVDVYAALVKGAGTGLETLVRIIPALVALMTAVAMLRASGALELLAGALAPVLELAGLPAELLPLMLVRPVSGSAALGVGAELMAAYGPDSRLGRMAAVMLGSTETTFYTVSVYSRVSGVFRPPPGGSAVWRRPPAGRRPGRRRGPWNSPGCPPPGAGRTTRSSRPSSSSGRGPRGP